MAPRCRRVGAVHSITSGNSHTRADVVALPLKADIRSVHLRAHALALLWQIPRFGEPIGDSRIDFSMIHRGSAFGGPTMGNASSDWEDELERWLKPFLDRLGHKARRRMSPVYI